MVVSEEIDDAARGLQAVGDDIVACRRCPRLIEHSQNAAIAKRRAFMEWKYWGKPLPGFGDPGARLLVVGLAPAAHGGNRTGRMFTGDASADWLIEAMHAYGFANQPHSVAKDDGLKLHDAFITAAARCAPPQNRPTAAELANCQPFMERELALLTRVQVVIVLGQIAHHAFWRVLQKQGRVPARAARPAFAHGSRADLGPGGPVLLISYHPSRQNTQTGRLTKPMFWSVFAAAREILDVGGRPDDPGEGFHPPRPKHRYLPVKGPIRSRRTK